MESENNKRTNLSLRLHRDKLDLQLTDPNSKHAKELKERIQNMQQKIDHPKSMACAAYRAVASRLNGKPVVAAVDKQKVGELIRLLFELNPEPTDEQIHGVARAINLDPAEFEGIIYDDYGHMVQASSTHQEPGLAIASPLTNAISDPVSNKGAQANDGTFVEDDAPVVNDGLLEPQFDTDIVDETTQM